MSTFDAWKMVHNAYYHVRRQHGPREARVILNELAGQLFEEMFKEAA